MLEIDTNSASKLIVLVSMGDPMELQSRRDELSFSRLFVTMTQYWLRAAMPMNLLMNLMMRSPLSMCQKVKQWSFRSGRWYAYTRVPFIYPQGTGSLMLAKYMNESTAIDTRKPEPSQDKELIPVPGTLSVFQW